jgi:adenylyltransferase/sulfurtransferase
MAEPKLEITVHDLKKMREEGVAHLVVDVREAWELDVAALPDVKHIPLGDLKKRYAELPKDRPLVMFCRSGRRSMDAALFLHQQGYPKAVNLRGGVLAWSAEIDPSMKTY